MNCETRAAAALQTNMVMSEIEHVVAAAEIVNGKTAIRGKIRFAGTLKNAS